MASDRKKTATGTIMSDIEIIDRFGGIRPMAAKLGVAVTTVQGWKVRGHFPDGRRDEILDMAAKLGIDMGGGGPAAEPEPVAEPKPEPEQRPKIEAAPAQTAPGKPERRPSAAAARPAHGFVAWIALMAAIIVGAAVVTVPWWGPILNPAGSAPGSGARTAAEIQEMTANIGRLSSELTARLDLLNSRVVLLEQGAGEDLGPQLAALDRGLGSLSTGLEALNAGITGMEARIAAVESAPPKVPESVAVALAGQLAGIAALNDGVATLRGELAALGARVTELETRPIQTGYQVAVVALAIGQLAAAVNAGWPYRNELDGLELVARDDALVLESDAIAALSPWADHGIWTRAALHRRFAEIAPAIYRALEESGSDDWLDQVWDSLKTVVTWRRTEGDSPVSRAEAALAKDDLKGAVAAFEGEGSLGIEGNAWLAMAENRLLAEAEIFALYSQVTAPFDGPRENTAQ